jgi:hypothetical protein
MRAMSDHAMLDLWECGSRRAPLDRALLLLAAAAPELPAASIADISITERDARVLRLRTATFGRRLNGLAQCPQCNAQLEFGFDGDALDVGDHAETFVTTGGLHFRLPSSRDLALAIADGDDDETIARTLVRRCCVDGDDRTEWSDALCREAEAGLDDLSERAGLQLHFNCGGCGAQWQAPLDVCDWLWREIERHAKSLLDDVHSLASAYGWSEQQILELNPARRAAYLERCFA